MNNLPQFVMPVAVILVSMLAYTPLIYANFEGMSKLPSQIIFTSTLGIILFLYAIIGGIWLSPGKILLPGIIAIVWQAFITYTIMTSEGSTAAIGLYLIPIGHVILVPIGVAIAYFIGW